MLVESLTKCASTDELLEDFAFRYGLLLRLVSGVEPGRECFWSAQRLGAISYVRAGRYLHASGGFGRR